VLIALRECESASARLADRRRVESEAREERSPTLSELLLVRWRAGDWAVLPDDVRKQL
jgi:hypothetical protein